MDQPERPSLIGRTVGHYRINSAIGAGGMGEVYRATDAKLGREIALKVLPPEMAGDPDRLARFQREARAIAALNHPNVVTVYSVEESENIHFITMELIEGHPLDHLISSNGLPVERIVEIAAAIAEALAVAHEKSIVHRDLKPANVMVTNDGRVKVLDFGLSKDVSAEAANDATLTSAGRTQAGMVMGTPAYMSPEQVAGRPLDHRSDIFSFGVVLHEMATGRRPFEGNSSAELISSILRDNPLSVTDARPELPSELARVIRRCLEKDPRHRLQTARDVSNEFRDMARNTTHAGPLSASAPQSSVASASSTAQSAAREDEGFWVAVLPFKYGSANADLIALAEGLSEEVITGLSRFSYLKVIARSSTARYAGQSVDVRSAGKELNARYVMEGTLRHAGSKLRLAVQLVDTTTGAHLWAENYERAFSPETVFELQDDLVPRIVSTVADMNGVLPHRMSEGLRGRSPEQLSPYEAVLRSFAYTYSATPEELGAARSALEAAVRKAPGYSDAWAMLSFLCGQDYVHGYELQANALETAVTAARKAVALGPSNHLAYFSLAQALWREKDHDSFRDAVERAVVLNPMDGNSVAYLGELLTYAGDSERGMQLVGRAKQLNPNHPGWYWFADFYHAFSQGDYRAAHAFALKAKLRGNPLAPMFLAAACGQVGDVEGGAKAAAELVKFRPELPAAMRKQVAKVWNPEYGERFLEGLRRAGLEIPEAEPVAGQRISGASASSMQRASQPISQQTSTPQTGAVPDSGATRAEEGFWVAVLPFKYTGENRELRSLAEGLTEEIITGLSRFSYLRVIARGSTAKYSSETGDVRAIGKELGAHYVMEGSLRQAGNKLRLAVQLVDATTGAHLWAETYERAFTPDALFELQDDLVPRIVSIVADMNGALPRSMSAAVRGRDPDSLSPYEAVLRSFGYFEVYLPDNLAQGRAALEAAVKKAPSFGDAWAMLALLNVQDFAHGFDLHPHALRNGAEAARRAVAVAPTNHLAFFAQAQVHFFQKEFPRFRNAAERTLALNPMDGNAVASIGEFFVLSGDAERGMELAGRAKRLNPNHPGWYWHADFNYFYSKRDYRAAVDAALKSNLPGYFGTQALLAAGYGQLGDVEEARKTVQELVRLRPDTGSTVRQVAGKWFAPDHLEHFIEGLRKAGLEVSDDAAKPASTKSTVIAAVTPSGAMRAEESFWVAVLPFKYTGDNRDLKAFAEGAWEEIITGLSRFSYLRVIARGSAAKYSSESGDVRAIGKELGARYVIEASLRQAGSKLRLAVQLVDANTGSHVWAETYERTFDPETVFDLQDELVPRIVSTVADAHGILAHTLSEGIQGKTPEQLTPFEAVLCGFRYSERLSLEEHKIARDALERAVEVAPNYAYGWAMLGFVIDHEYAFGYNPKPDSLERGLQAARRAVELDSSGHRGYQALAEVHFYRREIEAFRSAAERALNLNPLDGCNVAGLGTLIAYAGEWERGCALVNRALQLNPNHPGWYWFPLYLNAYRKKDYKGALGYALKTNLPKSSGYHMALAVCYGQLGQREEAAKSAQEMLKLAPQFAQIARPALRIRFDAELTEHLIDGLRKAGVEISEP